MEDFNNIQTDPIPEGLEFNESYMQSAFELYDAEKRKRKRRLIIWWITSALGFSSVLLIGTYFFMTNGHLITSDKKAALNKAVVSEESKTGTNETAAGNIRPDKIKTVYSGSQISPNTSRVPEKTSGVKSGLNGKLPASKSKTNRNLNTQRNYQRKKAGKTVYTIHPDINSGAIHEPADSTDSNRRMAALNRIAKIDSASMVAAPDELPLKPALLAFSGDNTAQLPENTPNPLPQKEESDAQKHRVFMNLGVNTLFGMQELKNRTTFRESVGISYSYQLNPKIAIGAGLEYHSISRITYKRMIGDTTNSDNTTTILNKTTLNYISFLPQVDYRLGTKHRLTAGFGIGYLLLNPGERYEIENYTQENSKRTNSKLYYSTFNKFNFSASLGYSYQFSPFMSAQVTYHYGFTDITINNSFNKTFDRNSRLQLGLKIKLY